VSRYTRPVNITTDKMGNPRGLDGPRKPVAVRRILDLALQRPLQLKVKRRTLTTSSAQDRPRHRFTGRQVTLPDQ